MVSISSLFYDCKQVDGRGVIQVLGGGTEFIWEIPNISDILDEVTQHIS